MTIESKQVTIIGFESNGRGALLRNARSKGFPIQSITNEELVAIWINTEGDTLPHGVEVMIDKSPVATVAAPEATPAVATVAVDPKLAEENARLKAQLNAHMGTIEAPRDDNATCTVNHKSARDIFGADAPDVLIPTFEWSPVQPHAVPTLDEHYQFRADLLARVLLALATNQRCYLYGHTGTGKTTLYEQVAARLQWPLTRINLDTEIGRLELLGKEALREESGATVSAFQAGAVVTAMDNGHILLIDEIDAGAPECLFILQALAEGRPLNLLEDNRVVEPQPTFRLVASANTNGQVDESGHYQGTKALNAAFLNRFTIWGEVGYLSEAQECQILIANGIEKTFAKECAAYSRLHHEAFVQGEISIALTLRTLKTFADNAAILGRENAFGAGMLDCATSEDRAIIEALYSRALA